MSLPSFVETPRFPDAVGFGSTGGPGFKTEVFTSASGFEQRNMLWQAARSKFNVSTGVREKADMDELLGFFYSVRGRAIGFRFKDWGDFELSNEQIGIGDGVKTEFQITKTYGTGAAAYVRNITKPVASTITVTVNGNVALIPTDVTLDATTGKLTFASPPPSTHVVRVSGEFDIPCRFDTDELPRSYDDWQAMAVQINVVEIR